jgi:uncharacterized membrane protein YgdD (TMEM256/DUF423 family)
VAGFTGLGLDAVAAHGLKSRMAPDMLGVFETAVRYQMYHAFGLFAAAWGLARWQHRAISVAGVLFIIGMVLFCGSIYVHALTGVTWLSLLTPLGGTTLLTGWLCLAMGAWRASGARS